MSRNNGIQNNYLSNENDATSILPNIKKNITFKKLPNKDTNNRKRLIESVEPYKPPKKITNSSNFIPMPVTNKPGTSNQTSFKQQKFNKNQNSVTESVQNTQLKSNVNIGRSLKIVTANIEKCLKYARVYSHLNLLYEVYANVLSIREGNHVHSKVFLLRNDSGPVIQAIYYEMEIILPYIAVGDLIRCIGRCVDKSRLQIFKLQKIGSVELENATRLMTISNYILSKEKNNY